MSHFQYSLWRLLQTSKAGCPECNKDSRFAWGHRTAVIEVDMRSQVPAHLTSSSISSWWPLTSKTLRASWSTLWKSEPSYSSLLSVWPSMQPQEWSFENGYYCVLTNSLRILMLSHWLDPLNKVFGLNVKPQYLSSAYSSNLPSISSTLCFNYLDTCCFLKFLCLISCSLCLERPYGQTKKKSHHMETKVLPVLFKSCPWCLWEAVFAPCMSQLSSCSKIPQTGFLIAEMYCLILLEALKPKTKNMSMVGFLWGATSSFVDGHLLAVSSHALSLCVHAEREGLSPLIIWHQSSQIRTPPLWSHLNFIS